jgi:hypothetical protein
MCRKAVRAFSGLCRPGRPFLSLLAAVPAHFNFAAILSIGHRILVLGTAEVSEAKTEIQKDESEMKQ